MIPQHSLQGGRYPLPGPDFHRLDRASFAWRTQTDSQGDLRSNALMVARFGSTPAGEFFRGFLEGEVQALGLLLDFAKAPGLDEDDLKAYEPRPEAQTYPAYVAWL